MLKAVMASVTGRIYLNWPSHPLAYVENGGFLYETPDPRQDLNSNSQSSRCQYNGHARPQPSRRGESGLGRRRKTILQVMKRTLEIKELLTALGDNLEVHDDLARVWYFLDRGGGEFMHERT